MRGSVFLGASFLLSLRRAVAEEGFEAVRFSVAAAALDFESAFDASADCLGAEARAAESSLLEIRLGFALDDESIWDDSTSGT